MEFEPNKPATEADIALAEAPRVTLQPTHPIDSQPTVIDRSHQHDGSFAFEAESTLSLSEQVASEHPHHKVALIVAACSVAIFVSFIGILIAVR